MIGVASVVHFLVTLLHLLVLLHDHRGLCVCTCFEISPPLFVNTGKIGHQIIVFFKCRCLLELEISEVWRVVVTLPTADEVSVGPADVYWTIQAFLKTEFAGELESDLKE